MEIFNQVATTASLFPDVYPVRHPRSVSPVPKAREKDDFAPVIISQASILPYKLALTRYCVNRPRQTQRKQTFQLNFADNNTRGQISKSANKNIEKCLQFLLYRAKWKRVWSEKMREFFGFRISFITLTLPAKQRHSDQEIKAKVLKPFIQRCARKYKMERYLWRAECQLNGNIHFHLTTDVYIPHNSMRDDWNECLQLLGYIDDFEREHKHRDPNSTDVHSVKHVRNLVSYLCKYLGKNRHSKCIGELRMIGQETFELLYDSEEYLKSRKESKRGRLVGHVIVTGIRFVEGRQWFASKSLQSLQPVRIDEGNEDFSETIEKVMSEVNSIRRYDYEHCYVFFGEIFKLLNLS